MPAKQIPAPTRRADAARNRDKILVAARAAFADPDADADADVSMAEISRRAGVGMATLYRNFPGRQELLEALYTDEVSAVCEAAVCEAAVCEAAVREAAVREAAVSEAAVSEAAETIGGQTPGAALVGWLRRFFAFTTSKRHIAVELLKQTDRSDPLFETSRTRVIAAGRPLLAAAQHAHEVRDDLGLEQILDMIVAIGTIHGDRGYTEPILQAALDGLRPAADAKMSDPPGTMGS